MNRINFYRTALGFLATLLAAGIAHAQKDVNVVNTPSVNVNTMPPVTISGVSTVNVSSLPPVTGSVSITNSPAVTGTVDIGNSPTVQVGNTKSSPANALDVERAARIPYESSQSVSGFPTVTATFTAAPSGYRLVLQHVSAVFGMNAGSTQIPYMALYGKNSVGRASWAGQVGNVGSQSNGSINADFLSYWDSADGQPFVQATGDFYPGEENWITLSGYLENCSITGCPPIQR